MEKVIAISFGELTLKGANRSNFENKLIARVRKKLSRLDNKIEIYRDQGKLYIRSDEDKYDEMVNVLRKIFGIFYITPAIRVEKDIKKIEEAIRFLARKEIEEKKVRSFRGVGNRADKTFPIKSPELGRMIGGVVLEDYPDLNVDLTRPDLTITVDIRRFAYIYTDEIRGAGGLPTGTGGRGLCLLSGGIDSPVAFYQMARRGLELSGVHYHSYPFTSQRAENKVKDLAGILAEYTGRTSLYSVNILEIQKAINKNCDPRYMTIISRRFMMRIANKIAIRDGFDSLVTGEALGQVASQTIEGIKATNLMADLPVLRPLIAMDKIEIIDIARRIGSYETSILPFKDSCTVFLPKNPVIKPRIRDIEKEEEKLNIDQLVDNAIEKMEIFKVEDK